MQPDFIPMPVGRISPSKLAVINVLQGEPSYDQILHLGSELTRAFRNAASVIDHHESGGEAHSPSQFAYSCYDHLRRFLLCLHFPYAVKAKQNPLYSYSLKMRLECALNLVSLLDDDMYNRLLLVGSMFRDIITRGALVIYMELISQLEADGSRFTKKKSRACREPLLKDARKVVRYAQDRLWYGETNVKGYLSAWRWPKRRLCLMAHQSKMLANYQRCQQESKNVPRYPEIHGGQASLQRRFAFAPMLGIGAMMTQWRYRLLSMRSLTF